MSKNATTNQSKSQQQSSVNPPPPPLDDIDQESDLGIDEEALSRLRGQSQYASGLEDLDSDDEDELESESGTENVDTAKLVRMLYQLPVKNKELSFNMSVFVNYMREHKIDSVLAQVLQQLLEGNQLPYNPHAGFHRALKVQNQKFYFDKISDDSIIKAINMSTYSSEISYLAGIRKFNNVWGLASVIRTMSPVHLKEFEWLLHSITPDKTTLVYHEGFSSQVVLSLVGPASFYGTFYPFVHTLNFRLHYVVMGADNRELALRIFAESVLNDVFHAMNQTEHLLLGLYIENEDCGGYSGVETDRYFTPEYIVANEEIILDELVNAATGAQKVSSEMMFLLDPELMTYKRGQKQYECYFIDQSMHTQEDPEEIFSFAEYFMASVYEGCFLRKHEAEAYMGLFCARQILVNFDVPPKGLQPNLRSNFTENRRLPYKAGGGYGEAEKRDERKPRAEVDEPIDRTEQIRINRALEEDVGFKSRVLKSRAAGSKADPRRVRDANNASNSRFLGSYSAVELERPLSPVWNHGITYPEERTKPVLNRGRGVKITAEEREEDIRPDSRQIKAPLRIHFERNICQLDHRNREFFEQVHKLILLNLMDKGSSDQDMLMALYRILHSHGWKVFCVMMHNQALQEAIFAYMKSRVSVDVINLEFKRYREELNFTLGSDLQEKSSDYVSLLMRCNYLLDQITVRQDPPLPLPDVLPLSVTTIALLRSVNSMIEAQLIWNMENLETDAFPMIMNKIEELRVKYPKDYVVPSTPVIRREKGQKFEPKTKWKPPVQQKADVFVHGNEYKFVMEQDDLFVVLQNAFNRSPMPESIRLDAILLQYLIDTRVDQVWMDYVTDIACCATLPPNPWPRLITAFREAALKMELFFEYEEDLLARVIDINAGKVVDRENFIYNIPSTKIFAHKTIMPIVSMKHGQKMIDYAQMFDNKQFPKSIGQFKIASTLALVGHTFLYGKVTPYLGVLELDEHVFFKGPSGCWFEALQHFCGLIWSHLQDLDSAYRTVSGTFMGYNEKRMSLVDSLSKPKAFKAELEYYLRRKEPVYIKTYVVEDWRYIPVVKHLKLHYINENETDRELFFQEDWANLHTNLFWLRNKAAFHFQQAGPPLQQDPCNRPNLRHAINDINKRIKKAKEQVDYLGAYRWLCTRSLLEETFDHVASCWRMSNSTVGMLEYCNVLNKSLQELIVYAIESPYEEEKSPLKSVSLGMMANAYRYKINKSLERVGALAPSNLDELTQEKLRECMEWDELSRNAFLKIEDRSLEVLREVYDLTQGVIVAVAYDVNSVCEKSGKALRGVKLRKNPHVVMEEVQMTFDGDNKARGKVDEWKQQEDRATVVDQHQKRAETSSSSSSSKRSNRPKYVNHPYLQTKDPFPNI